MSTTKQFTNIKASSKYQIDAFARGYYDFRTTVVPQPNKPLSFDMKVYDGLNYTVDLIQNSVRPAEINFDGTILPQIDNNSLAETNYVFGESGLTYEVPVYEKVYDNISTVGSVNIENGITSNFSASNYLSFPRNKLSGNETFIVKFKLDNTNNQCIWHTECYTNLQIQDNKLFVYNWNTNSNQYILDTIETNKWYWCKYVITNVNQRTVYLSTDGVNYEEKLTWTDNNVTTSGSLSYGTYDYILFGTSSYDTSNYMYGTIDLSESSITIGETKYDLNSSTLNLTGTYESKIGIFKDYEDNGKAKTLNCFSYNNLYTVLSSNENIEDKEIKYYKYSYQTFERPNMTKDIAVGGDEFGVESDITMLDGNNVFKGFDNDKTTYFHSDSGKTVGYFTFYNPNPLKVTALTFTQQKTYLTRSTSGGTVYGSNDNVNWIKITEFTHSEQVLTWTLDLSMNTEYYKYYKVYSNGTLGDSYYVFADCAITADERIISEGTPDDYDEKIEYKYTYLGTVDIPKHNIYDVDNFYGWAKDSNSIFTKTLQLSTDIPLYNSSYKEENIIINGTFTKTPSESNGIVSDFNGGILKLNFTDPTTEIKFYSKVTASDQSREHQIMGVDGTSNNIGRDNNVWRLWNGSGHYGSAFDINANYWVCLVDNRSGTYTMYVLKDSDYTKETLPELSSWNKEFEISGNFFESTNCLIGGAIYDSGSVSENWTGTIDLNNTWFESGDTKLWEGTSEITISSFTDDSITLSNNDVYARNKTLDKHFVLPKEEPTPVEPSDESDVAIAFNEEVANQDLGSDIYVNSGQGINEYYYTAYPVNDIYKSNSTILATISKKTQSGDNTLIDFDRKEESKVLTLDVSTNEDDAIVVTNNYEPTKVDFNIVQDDVTISTQSYNDGEQPSSKYSMLNFKFNVDVTEDEVEIVVDGIKYKLSDLPIVANIASGYGVKVNKTGYKPYQTVGRKWYKNVININLKTEE